MLARATLPKRCYNVRKMPRRSRKPPADENVATFDAEARLPGEQPEQVKNPAAQTLGRLGGLKGGKARAESLTPEKRAEIAKAAAMARWKKK